MAAKHIDSFSVGLNGRIPCHSSLLLTVAPGRESGGQSCALGMSLGILLFRSMDAFFFREETKKRSGGAARQWQPEGAAGACCQGKQGSHLM